MLSAAAKAGARALPAARGARIAGGGAALRLRHPAPRGGAAPALRPAAAFAAPPTGRCCLRQHRGLLAQAAARGEPAVPEGVVVHREHCAIGWDIKQVYGVVADVGQYVDFLPWCKESKVHATRTARDGQVEWMDAEIAAGLLFFREQFRSEVVFVPPSPRGGSARINAHLTGGNIVEYLVCNWSFRPSDPARIPASAATGGRGTEVQFEVAFKFRNPMHQEVTRVILSQVVETMVSSFEQRARQLYGAPRHARVALPLREAPADWLRHFRLPTRDEGLSVLPQPVGATSY